MQHVTSRRKVEGQDFVESIHPAPSPDQLRKAGRGVQKKKRQRFISCRWSAFYFDKNFFFDEFGKKNPQLYNPTVLA